tara:strand:+ start:292 stop:612 length:321 start_codon:yes stop_codon:yes gene_type:complete
MELNDRTECIDKLTTFFLRNELRAMLMHANETYHKKGKKDGPKNPMMSKDEMAEKLFLMLRAHLVVDSGSHKSLSYQPPSKKRCVNPVTVDIPAAEWSMMIQQQMV